MIEPFRVDCLHQRSRGMRQLAAADYRWECHNLAGGRFEIVDLDPFYDGSDSRVLAMDAMFSRI